MDGESRWTGTARRVRTRQAMVKIVGLEYDIWPRAVKRLVDKYPRRSSGEGCRGKNHEGDQHGPQADGRQKLHCQSVPCETFSVAWSRFSGIHVGRATLPRSRGSAGASPSHFPDTLVYVGRDPYPTSLRFSH